MPAAAPTPPADGVAVAAADAAEALDREETRKKADWRKGYSDDLRSLRVRRRVGQNTLDQVNDTVGDWHKQM